MNFPSICSNCTNVGTIMAIDVFCKIHPTGFSFVNEESYSIRASYSCCLINFQSLTTFIACIALPIHHVKLHFICSEIAHWRERFELELTRFYYAVFFCNTEELKRCVACKFVLGVYFTLLSIKFDCNFKN